MKKTFKLLALILALVMVLSAFPVFGFADDDTGEGDTGEPESSVVQIDICEEDGQSGIQSALDRARDNATDEKPYYINVGAGTYWLDYSLHIYSNTYLKLDEETTFIKIEKDDKRAGDNMIKTGSWGIDDASGYFYKNITIDGGNWNENFMGNTAVKLVHGKNITVKNIHLSNITDSHFMEVAAVNGITIDNCSFTDQVHDSNLVAKEDANEAIQFDLLNARHINGYSHMEDEVDYLNHNITVTNCTFKNLNRGIGSHTAVNGKYYKNVVFKNNTFSGIRSNAIICFNMQNVDISGNTISSVGNGIEFDAMTANANGFIPSNDEGFVPKIQTSNAKIYNNKITVTGTDAANAIYIRGSKFLSAVKNTEGYTMPAANYYISGVTISKNTLSVKGANSCPIILTNTKSSVVDNNTITGARADYIGIYIKGGCTAVSVTNNKINAKCLEGIKALDYPGNMKYAPISVDKIDKNVIPYASKFGIRLTDTIANSVSSNTISNTGAESILVEGGKSPKLLINNNKITSPKGRAVYVKGPATIGNINYNTISNPAGDAIVLNEKVVSNRIGQNTITGGRRSIWLIASSAKSVDANVISGCSDLGLCFENSASCQKVSANKISKCKNIAIRVHKNCSVKLYPNTFSGNKVNGYVVSGTKNYTVGNLAYVKSAAKKNGKTIRVTWNKNTKATGFYVYRSTKATSGFSLIGKVSSKYNYYNDKTAKAGTYYYYRVMAYRNIPGSKAVQYSSYNTSAKAKR